MTTKNIFSLLLTILIDLPHEKPIEREVSPINIEIETNKL